MVPQYSVIKKVRKENIVICRKLITISYRGVTEDFYETEGKGQGDWVV